MSIANDKIPEYFCSHLKISFSVNLMSILYINLRVQETVTGVRKNMLKKILRNP